MLLYQMSIARHSGNCATGKLTPQFPFSHHYTILLLIRMNGREPPDERRLAGLEKPHPDDAGWPRAKIV